jgi:hypothetical protein
MDKDSIINDQNELVKGLLNKCEASNLPQLYVKYMNNCSGLCTFNQIFSFNNYFTEERILSDIATNNNFITMGLYPEIIIKYNQKLHRTGLTEEEKQKLKSKLKNLHELAKSHPFTPVKCICSKGVMGLIINLYVRNHFISKTGSIEDLQILFGIQNSENSKFAELFKDLVDKHIIFAEIQQETNGNQTKFRILWKINHPMNKNLKNELIVTLIIAPILLITLIILINNSVNGY